MREIEECDTMSQEPDIRVTENKMGTQPVGRLLAGMAIPMMISMLVQALYNIVRLRLPAQ